MYERRSVRDLEPYQWGEQPRPVPGLVKLNTNENPYPPPASVAKALKSFPVDALRLYPDPACTPLRKAASKVFRVPGENLLFTNGSDEAIALFFRTFFQRDDAAVFTQHTYSAYRAYADALDIPWRNVPMADDFRIPMAGLERTPGKAVFITNPNAPTGIELAADEIVALARRQPRRLFVVDEAYADFGTQSVMERAIHLPNVVVLRTFSKSASFCGMRLGFACAHVDLIAAMNKVKDPYNVNVLNQTLGTALLGDWEIVKANVAKVVRERESFSLALEKLGLRVLPSATNFVMAGRAEADMETIYRALAKKKIYVRFFPKLRGWLRITIGTPEQMKKTLAALGPLVRKLA